MADDEKPTNRRPAREAAKAANSSAEVQSDDAAPLKCFVIGPIGSLASETRKRSNQILRHIIEPVVTAAGYATPQRADHLSESGRITRQIIQRLVEDDLVVADLTESNPNVYYELAIRHVIKKPFVQLIASAETLPFDIAEQRTIFLDVHDLDSVASAKEEMTAQVTAIQSGTTEIDTPLTFALDVASLRGSDNPSDRSQGEILAVLQELRDRMVQPAPTPPRRSPHNIEDIMALRRYVEATSANADVYDSDLDNLAVGNVSEAHSKWLKTVMQNKMPFMNPARPSPKKGEWGAAPWSTEPTF